MDGVGLKYVGAIIRSGIDVFVDLACVKRCVVVIADGEENDVGSQLL